MAKNKTAYFQGTEEPAPKKKKYKSEPAIIVQPRFKEPLFKNYDLYETEGVNGPAKHGPGAGLYQNMEKYKSVDDFLKKKRKRNKDKYKADDFYIQDNVTIIKKKIALRMIFLQNIIKFAIDFPIDDQIESSPILGENGTYSDSIPIGGQLDEYLPQPDFEGKTVDQLDFGRDYTESSKKINFKDLSEKPLNPQEPYLYGLPDGVAPSEDLDAINNENPQYGITDSGNTLYDKLSI